MMIYRFKFLSIMVTLKNRREISSRIRYEIFYKGMAMFTLQVNRKIDKETGINIKKKWLKHNWNDNNI